MGSRGSLSGAAQVSFAADAMLAAVFRVALKAFGERARFLTLPGPGFRQVQLDADFLRQVSLKSLFRFLPLFHVQYRAKELFVDLLFCGLLVQHFDLLSCVEKIYEVCKIVAQ